MQPRYGIKIHVLMCLTRPIDRPIFTHFRGDAFYADVNTLGLEEMHKDSEEAIDKMCNDLEKQYVITVAYILYLHDSY